MRVPATVALERTDRPYPRTKAPNLSQFLAWPLTTTSEPQPVGSIRTPQSGQSRQSSRTAAPQFAARLPRSALTALPLRCAKKQPSQGCDHDAEGERRE